jgi:hypothetical protein
MLIVAAAVAMLLVGFVLVDLFGFRVFVFCIVTWIVWAGITLVKAKGE